MALGLALAIGGGIFAFTRGEEIGPSEHELVNRYPALWKADADTVREIREILTFAGVMELDGTPLESVLDDAGEDAPLALLRVVMERHAEVGSWSGLPVRSPFEELDGPHLRVDWIAARRDPTLNAVLLRIIGDQEISGRIRTEALRAVSWPGNAAVVEPLTDLVLDDGVPWDLRTTVLLRLPGIGRPLPGRLRALLTGRMDYLAAWALAKGGDETVWPLLREARLVFADDRIALKRLDEIDVLAAPAASDHSDERSLDEILSERDDDLDLLDAILAIRHIAGPRRAAFHAKLDRLTRTIAGEIREGDDPERVIGVLNRHLLPRGAEPGPWSFLPDLLAGRNGNCLGRCSLYLAVSRELHLPIYPVYSPTHVFLRWEGEGYRRNIEVTEGGAAHDNHYYVDGRFGDRVSADSLARGIYLRRITIREFLAGVLANHAGVLNSSGRFEEARAAADQALSIYPESIPALTQAATSIFRTGPGDENVALDALDQAIALNEEEIGPRKLRLEILMDLERYEEALAECDRMLSIEPERSDAVVARVTGLLRLGRLSEAQTMIDGIEPIDDPWRDLDRDRLQVAHFVLSREVLLPCDWETLLGSMVGDDDASMERNASLYQEAARAFLTPIKNVPPDPKTALEILDQVRSRGPEWHRLRVRALLLQGQVEQARSQLDYYFGKPDPTETREDRKLRLLFPK